jgi:hypothetical protein
VNESGTAEPDLSAADMATLLTAGYAQPTPAWLYVVRAGLVPGTPTAEFHRWYDEIHLPRILSVPGFNWASRYLASGESSFFVTIYSVDGPEVFESEAYASLPGWEHWRGSLVNWTRGLYRLDNNLGHRGR